ncbi:GW dipeptide domain-containing protein [Staphylococcus sp. IVB6227]|uniref:GW dipeptide domain-containing protein n=1 Tax=Staphylococcus sp. IVB6227 TaxID=2989768 RepID=UPI0021D3762F|nr:GW dipeptide domain-containing protein [Staphylococcus sp. IVB6227]UXR78925.1 GW dipeptide domain-containing protein [Staphylococcus sp. IVB6227]
MVKKFGYKTPSMIALTLAGTALTAQHVDAAETSQKSEVVNVLNDETAKQQGEVAKQQTTESQQAIAGTQTYQDPAQVTLDSEAKQPAEQSVTSTTPQANQTDETVQATPVDETETTQANEENSSLTKEEAPIPESEIDLHSDAEDTPPAAQTAPAPSTVENSTSNVANNEIANAPVNQTATNDKVTAPANQTATNDKVTASVNQTASKAPTVNADAPTPPRIGGKGGPATPVEATTFFRSATAAPKMSAPTYKPKVKSSINTYIRNKNFTVPKYEEDYSRHIPRYGYRGGVGKPEGIVIHDTANDSSTIDGEIAYMKRNAHNAFVHGFIDGKRIVETQPTDYLAYGAGYAANQRFIHMELVHVHDYDSFARQMNNMADYVATNLQYYGLKPDSAEYDGRGTVWTHLAVTRHLGGTDHVDPHGYLRAHNYSYNELYDLIQEKYQTKMGITTPAVSKATKKPVVKKPTVTKKPATKPATTAANNTLKVSGDMGYGRINTTNKGLYTTVYDQKGVKTNKTNQTLKVTKNASLNGKQFYLVTDSKINALIGWVNKGDVQYQKAQAVQSVRKNVTLKPGTTVYDVPWGTKTQVKGQSSKTAKQTFAVQKQQKIGTTQWLYGTVNKLTGWVNSNSIVTTPVAKPTVKKPVAKPAVKKPAVKKPVAKPVVKKPAVKKPVAKPAVKKPAVKKPVAKPAVKKPAVKKPVAKPVVKKPAVKKPVAKPVVKKPAVKKPAVKKPVAKPVVKTVSTAKKPASKVVVKKPVAKKLTKTPVKAATASPLKVSNDTGMGRINTKNNGLRATVFDKQGVKTAATERSMRVSKKASLNGQDYYLVTDYLSGTHIGWVKKQDVNYRKSEYAQVINKNFTINAGTKLYAAPWGSSHQVVGTVKGKNNQPFKAIRQQKVANTVYLYGTTNNLAGWVNQSALSLPKAVAHVTSNVSRLGRLNANNSGLKASVYDKTSQNATQFADKTYKITKTATANNQNYVLLQNTNGKTPLGWVNAKDVFSQSLGATKAAKATYTVNKNTSGLYAMPWGTAKQRIDTLKHLANRTFNATKTVAVGKDTFLYGNVNRKTGWINKNDLTALKVAPKATAAKTVAPKKAAVSRPVTSQTLNHSNHYFVYNNNGYFYNHAGDKTAAGQLKRYYQNVFKVNKSTIVNGITWHYGAFKDGKKGWVKASDLRSQLTKQYQSAYTLDQAARKQYALTHKPQVQHIPGKWQNATFAEVRRAMDTERIAKDPRQKYQFLKLNQYQGLEASDLDKLLKNKGILNGQGQAFKEAAMTHNINEIYLISHALLETGHGTSKLSNGGYVNRQNQIVKNPSKKYYNMFGIGAYDHDAVRSGFKTAQNYGWDSVRKSIVGGAKFIKERYIGSGQNTLYRMRWNPHNPAVHQYATDITWASHNANRMKNFYDQIGESGKYFDVDKYKTK